MATMRKGKTYRHGTLAFYAVEGAIRVVDDADNFSDVISIAEAKRRRRMLQAQIKQVTLGLDAPIWMRIQRQDMRHWMETLNSVIYDAEQMGDPLDATVQGYNARHRRRLPPPMTEATQRRHMQELRALPALPRGEDRGLADPGGIKAAWQPSRHDLYVPPKKKAIPGVGSLILET